MSAAAQSDPPPAAPWRAAGLSDHQAARHALSRLGFGPRLGQVDEIVRSGLGRWLEGQIQGGDDGRVEALLEQRPFLRWSDERLVRHLGVDPQALRMAMSSGAVSAEDLAGGRGILRQRDAQASIDRLLVGSTGRSVGLDGNTMASQNPLAAELTLQKIVRAVLSGQQLNETLADFWFDHFNVSVSKARVAAHLVQYERDVIRARQWGTFRQLLGAVSRHPAMLHYLDNWRSRADGDRLTKFDFAMLVESTGPLSNPTLRQPVSRLVGWQEPAVREGLGLTSELGLNENFARELLELHTLGVDGGYDQWDVVDVARAFSGWTTMPLFGRYRQRMEGLFQEQALAEEFGFQRQAEFLFRPDFHDAEEKQILGVQFPDGGGFEEGERVLDILSDHPATARRVAYLLAEHLVALPPPEAVVDEATRAFANSDGDLRVVVWAIVQSPHFWRPPALPQRKTPLHFVVSALRALDARVVSHELRPNALWATMQRLGQPLYKADPPTGFEPIDEIWFAAGSLYERALFAFQLSYDLLPGWQVDLVALQGTERFTSADQAIARALDLILPTVSEEARQRIEQAFVAETVPPGQWFRRALWLTLASPEFQLR